MRDGQLLEDNRLDIELGEGIGTIFKNRKVGNNGVAYGGVGIFWKKAACDFKIVNIKNNADFEIIGAIGCMKKDTPES